EVRLDGRGRTVGIQLVSAAAGDAKGWERVAKSAALRLEGRSFVLSAAFSKGAKVSVDVIAEKTLPSGEVPLFNLKRKPLPKTSLPDDVSRAGDKLAVNERIFQVGIPFDSANIGARRRRHVRTSLTVSPMY